MVYVKLYVHSLADELKWWFVSCGKDHSRRLDAVGRLLRLRQPTRYAFMLSRWATRLYLTVCYLFVYSLLSRFFPLLFHTSLFLPKITNWRGVLTIVCSTWYLNVRIAKQRTSSSVQNVVVLPKSSAEQLPNCNCNWPKQPLSILSLFMAFQSISFFILLLRLKVSPARLEISDVTQNTS